MPQHEFMISSRSWLMTTAAGDAATLVLLGGGAVRFIKELHMRAALVLCFALMAKLSSANLCTAEDSWWQLLGPAGNGHANSADLPVQWTDQRNVAWKTAIHDRGWSSPVMLGNQIWLTTATTDGHKLYAVCVDKNTGRILHDRHVFDVAEPQKISDDNTYATPTPVIEQGRVFVHFGTYGTACLDSQTGETIWARRDLNCDHEANAGPASSPTIVAGNLVVHVDGRDVQYIIYLFDEDATCTIIRPGRKFDVLAVNSLASQPVRATPAVDGNALIVRTADSLYRIEAAAAADPRQSSANANDPTLTLPLVGYNEHRTNLPGGRQANVSTNRAMVVKADGTERRAIGGELVNEAGVWTQFAGWSPDGKTAVVLRGCESVENAQWEEEHKTFRFTPEGWLVDSFFVDVATGKAENVTAVERVSFYNTGLFFWPNDPTKLGFTALIGGNSKPFRMDRDGRNKTDLTKNSSGFAYGFSSSPDGSRISYHENYQVYLANADGSNRIHVQTGHPFVFVPSWSPDGKWVLFVSGEHYNCHPHIVKADGTGLKKLADRGGYRGVTEFLDVPDYHGGSSDIPVWSIDGQAVFYTAKVGNNVELFRVTLDGQSERLTNSADGTSHYHPKPSPDGQWIVYGSKRNGMRNLFVMRLSDRKEHALTDVPAGHAAMHAYWQPTELMKVKQ